MFRPINIVIFLAGIFTALTVQMLPFLNKNKIELCTRDVLLARFGHWAGFIVIIVALYTIAGAGGWAYDDMIALTRGTIILRTEWISSIALMNPNVGGQDICYFGNCTIKNVTCQGNRCFFGASPWVPSNSTAPNGSLLFPNTTSWVYDRDSVLVINQTLPRKAEIG